MNDHDRLLHPPAGSSAASRPPSLRLSGGIDGLGAGEDHAAADGVAARLDLLAVDEIDRARQQRLQSVAKIEEAEEIGLGRGELDQKIDVASAGVEIIPARSRPLAASGIIVPNTQRSWDNH